jgi:hypothetical protein
MAPALPPEVRRAGRVGSGPGREAGEHHRLGPGPEQIEVVGPRDEVDESGTRRARAHLGDGHAPVGTEEPLHVGQACLHPQRLQRRPRHRPDPLVSGTVHLPGEKHAPLDPRLPHHLQGRGEVVVDGVPDDLAPEGDGVEGVLLADDELLHQRRLPRGGRHLREEARQVVPGLDPERPPGPRSRRWLHDHREAHLLDEGRGLGLGADQGVPSARKPVSPEHVLHAGLVPEVLRHLPPHARQPEVVPHPPQGYLELLEGPEKQVDTLSPPPQLVHGARQTSRIQGVVHAQEVGELCPEGRGYPVGWILAHHREAHALQSSQRGDEPQRRLGQEGRHEGDVVHGSSRGPGWVTNVGPDP